MQDRLCLGTARESITPALGSHLFGYHTNVFAETVHDDLTATAFAFSQGGKKVLMVSVFLCILDTALMDALRVELGEKLGMPSDNILICATHTHCGPSMANSAGWGGVDMVYYETVFRPAVLRAAQAAFAGAEPVRMATASGTSHVGINRRQLNPDNTISLGQNPWGPFNPEMFLLSFRADSGRTVGTMICYGAHLTAAGCINVVTRDWAGPMLDAMDAVTGGITAFFNGPEGDVGPRLSNGKTVGNMDYVRELGGIAAADALRIYTQLGAYRDVTISAMAAPLQIPVKPRISYEEAVANYDPAGDNAVNLAKKKNEYYRRVKESYETGYTEQTERHIPQSVCRIGDVAFVAFPMELFSEVGMRIDRAVEALKVISLSNTNGTLAYFPTQDQLCRGGYEISSFRYHNIQAWVDDTDFHLLQQTLRNLAALER